MRGLIPFGGFEAGHWLTFVLEQYLNSDRNWSSLVLIVHHKMSKPCSQLNSKLIRYKAECSVIARVEKQCSIVDFKCVWHVQDKEIERAWNWICQKRDV